MGTFLSLHRKSPLLVSRWCSAWVLMWCSTFFSCSVFCERRLALLQTSQSRDVYLWKPPLPPRLLWMPLKVFVLHLRKHPYDSENSHYMNTETPGMHKKKTKNEEEAFIWMSEGQKHLECWTKTPNNPQLTNSWNNLSFLRLDGWF